MSLRLGWGQGHSDGVRPSKQDPMYEFNGVNFGCVCPDNADKDGKDPLCPTQTPIIASPVMKATSPFALLPEPGSYSSKLYRMPNGRFGDWFDCKTRRRPYDLLVMVSLIALKHHLGEAISVYSKATWPGEWSVGPGGFWSANPSPGAIQVYEHVFPDRAPVQNILDNDDDW